MSVRGKSVVHCHKKKAGSRTDKPKGTVIKTYKSKAAAHRAHKKLK